MTYRTSSPLTWVFYLPVLVPLSLPWVWLLTRGYRWLLGRVVSWCYHARGRRGGGRV